MKAITYSRYGSANSMRLTEIPTPVPAQGSILVRVRAASVNPADIFLMRGKPFLVRLMGPALFRPRYKVLGADVAGIVERVGPGVSEPAPGDEVFGDLSDTGMGAFAQYVCAPAACFARKPANVSFEMAAAAPLAGITALQGLRDAANTQPGQNVLINGASGGVGSLAVQMAKAFGARVTAVCSTKHIEMVRSLGADTVIDYTQTDFTTQGPFDLIFDAAAYRPLAEVRRALAPTGIHVVVGGSVARLMSAMLVSSWQKSPRLTALSAKANSQDLEVLARMLGDGRIKPVIQKRYPLKETAEALRYVGLGHTQGKVVIIPEPFTSDDAT